MARSALIIGASRGLGLGLARELVARGWRVTATARDPAQALGLTQLAKEKIADVAIEVLDITEDEQVDALLDRLKDRVFDLLFLNAGVAGPQHQSIDKVTPEEIGLLVYINAVAPVKLARRLMRQVRPGVGVIAFMSSLLGSIANNTSGGMDLYRVSKAALNMLTRGFIAKDIGAQSLTVLSMHPGWVRTDMGGAAAPLDVATSVKGLIDVVEQRAGTRRHGFVDYWGAELPW